MRDIEKYLKYFESLGFDNNFEKTKDLTRPIAEPIENLFFYYDSLAGEKLDKEIIRKFLLQSLKQSFILIGVFVEKEDYDIFIKAFNNFTSETTDFGIWFIAFFLNYIIDIENSIESGLTPVEDFAGMVAEIYSLGEFLGVSLDDSLLEI